MSCNVWHRVLPHSHIAIARVRCFAFDLQIRTACSNGRATACPEPVQRHMPLAPPTLGGQARRQWAACRRGPLVSDCPEKWAAPSHGGLGQASMEAWRILGRGVRHAGAPQAPANGRRRRSHPWVVGPVGAPPRLVSDEASFVPRVGAMAMALAAQGRLALRRLV